MIVGLPGYGLGQAPGAIPEAPDAGLMDALRKPARMIAEPARMARGMDWPTGIGLAHLALLLAVVFWLDRIHRGRRV